MTGYDFHPEARLDLDEIWEFISADSLHAADRMIAGFWQPLTLLRPFLIGATNALTSPRGLCASFWCANT